MGKARRNKVASATSDPPYPPSGTSTTPPKANRIKRKERRRAEKAEAEKARAQAGKEVEGVADGKKTIKRKRKHAETLALTAESDNKAPQSPVNSSSDTSPVKANRAAQKERNKARKLADASATKEEQVAPVAPISPLKEMVAEMERERKLRKEAKRAQKVENANAHQKAGASNYKTTEVGMVVENHHPVTTNEIEGVATLERELVAITTPIPPLKLAVAESNVQQDTERQLRKEEKNAHGAAKSISAPKVMLFEYPHTDHWPCCS
ncbi:hypothetical protein P7C70_g4394, partial [Phenoliferia sp. Uapishka_3]